MAHIVSFDCVPVKNTCYQCTKRQVGCHSTCQDYIQYQEYIACLKEAKRKETMHKTYFKKRVYESIVKKKGEYKHEYS